MALTVAALAAACAGGPRAAPPLVPRQGAVISVPPAQIVAMRAAAAAQARLDGVAFAVLSRATELCPDAVAPRLGIRTATAADYSPEWRAAATAALAVGDSVTVITVVRGSPADSAGLRPGDRLVRIGQTVLPTDAGAGAAYRNAVAGALAGPSAIPIMFERGDTFFEPMLRARAACAFPAFAVDGDAAAAWSDGLAIYVTTSMLSSVSDEDLARAIARELAHLVLGPGKRRGAGPAPLIDALTDVALPAAAASSPGAYARAGKPPRRASLPAPAERAADSLATRVVALAMLRPETESAALRGPPSAASVAAMPPAGQGAPRAVSPRPAAGPPAAASAPAATSPRPTAGPPPTTSPPAAVHAAGRAGAGASASAPAGTAGGGASTAARAKVAAPPAARTQPEQTVPEPSVAEPADALRGARAIPPAPSRGVPASRSGQPTARTTNAAWLYPAPDIMAAPLGRIPSGAVVIVVQAWGDWLRITSGTQSGYILRQDTDLPPLN